jgi:hypothetical protein
MITEKYCKKCDITKSISDFYQCKRNKDGFRFYCKSCELKGKLLWKKTEKGKAASKRYINKRIENGIHNHNGKKLNVDAKEKLCTKCKVIKPISDYWINKDGYIRDWCKECKREYDRKWRKTPAGKEKDKRYLESIPKTELRERWRLYHLKYKAREREYTKWYSKNTEIGRQLRKKSRHKRRGLGFKPLNKATNGTVAHHLNDEYVMYIPKELHERCAYPDREIHRLLVLNELFIRNIIL